MFGGIVEAVGRIASVSPGGGGIRMHVDSQRLDRSGLSIGDSIAVDGCCLTIVGMDGSVLAFDVSAETLACIAGFGQGRDVNLERALRLGDRIDGHLLQGHVDGVGTVVRFEPAPGDVRSVLLEIEAPASLARLIATKGSIAVNGVSLTSNRVEGRRFFVNLIPHTLAETTLGSLAAGARLNLEVDLLARYVARLAQASADA
ncbi:MAG: riboflavin synthase [Betaproteobacteria bacterium]